MAISFKGGIVISFLIHTIIIAPFYNVIMPGPHQGKEKLQLTVEYLTIKAPVKMNIVKRKDAKIVEKPKIEMAKTVDVKPVVDASGDVARKESQVKSTKDYINYYQLIRERIRQHLKANYTDYHNEGDVCLVFTLNADGRLDAVNIDQIKSTTDMKLVDIAVSSVKESSPFPPFPKAFNLPKMRLDLSISFRKE